MIIPDMYSDIKLKVSITQNTINVDYLKQVSDILTEEREEGGQLEENCVHHDAGGLGGGWPSEDYYKCKNAEYDEKRKCPPGLQFCGTLRGGAKTCRE